MDAPNANPIATLEHVSRLLRFSATENVNMDALRLQMADVIDAHLVAAQAVQGWVLVPRNLTAENGAKAALISEFGIRQEAECVECDGEGLADLGEECTGCSGTGLVGYSIDVPWSTIKEIHAAMVKHFHPE